MKLAICIVLVCASAASAAVGDIGTTRIMPGDVNGDGILTRTDIFELRESASGLRARRAPDPVYDFNGDGRATLADSVALQNAVNFLGGAMMATPREHSFIRGDVNGDQAVNVADLYLQVQRYLGDRPFLPNTDDSADIDGDGQLTITDVILLGQHL